MSEPEVDESAVRSDRRNRMYGLLCAGATYPLVSVVTDDLLFSMTVAAFVGIGVRMYLAYHSAISAAGSDQQPAQAYEATGNYHHGAVGASLVVASAVAFAVMVAFRGSTVALIAGIGAGVGLFPVLRTALPS